MAKAKKHVAPAKVVAAILDKSGSMAACRSEVIDGFNEFLGTLEGEANTTVSVTLFDTVVTLAHDAKVPADVPKLTSESYAPGGCTALLDAIGKTVSALGAKVGTGADAPSVVCLIMTDGQENSSQEFRL
mgnify:FL=1